MPEKPTAYRPIGPTRNSVNERARGSAASRGYDSRWQKARLLYLSENPLCVRCKEGGRDTIANEVDHIVPHQGDHELFWSECNWQSLCKRCHSKKTVRERMGTRDNIVVVTGLPASGKSTWVDEQRKPGDLVWDYDAMLATMTGLPTHSLPSDLLAPMCEMRDAFVRWLSSATTMRRVYVIAGTEGVANSIAQRLMARVHVCSCDEPERQRRLASRTNVH